MKGLDGLAVIIAIVSIVLVLIIIAGIFELIGMWKIFKKSGKKGWEAIVPFYNIWVLVEISGCKWWYFLIIIGSSLISFNYNINENISLILNSGIGNAINYYIMYMINYNIAKKFNKDYLYAIGLTFVPFVFYPMLGFGESKYDKNVKVSPYGVIKEGEI